MLQQILPEQAHIFWEKVRDHVMSAIPEVNGDSYNKANNILAELMIGSMVMWISYHNEGDKRIYDAVVITKIIEDNISEVKNLLIFCLVSLVDFIPLRSYDEGFIALGKYGRAHGCINVTGYLLDDVMLERVSRLGGNYVQSYVVMPI